MSGKEADQRRAEMERVRAAMHRNVRHPANQTVADRAMQDKGYPKRQG